jgi:hypothetical protein
MNGSLEGMMRSVAQHRDVAARDRDTAIAAQLHAITTRTERPIETERPRSGPGPLHELLGGALAPYAPAIEAAARRLESGESLSSRVDAIDRELHQLLATEAPATYAELRRPLVQMMRRIRRAIHALERHPAIGECS